MNKEEAYANVYNSMADEMLGVTISPTVDDGFRGFPSIRQYRDAVKLLKKSVSTGNSIAKFTGTVKLHGTNACIHLSPTNGIQFQSRNRILSLDMDNCGFMAGVYDKSFIQDLRNNVFCPTDDVYVYGEWCGGNIQKNVGLTQLPNMFVIFDVIKNGKRVHDISGIHYNEQGVYNAYQFKTFEIEINMHNPSLYQNSLCDITKTVEEQCPVSKHFGIDGVGEGVVWRLAEDFNGFERGSLDVAFKVKGSEHSSSKVRVLAQVDEEKVKSINDFLEYALNENRLNQGLDYMREMCFEISMNNIGHYLRWVFNDIQKEESDVMNASGIDKPDFGKKCSEVAKRFYLKAIQSDLSSYL